MKPISTSHHQTVVSMGSGGEQRFFNMNSNFVVQGEDGINSWFTFSMNIHDPETERDIYSVLESDFDIGEKWMHVAATVDSKGVGKLYKDGVELNLRFGSYPFVLAHAYSTILHPAFVGEVTATGETFLHGNLSDVRVYTRALSAEEINNSIDL